jgi:hypothetical protein
MTTRGITVHILIVLVIVALTGLAMWLNWGPVVHSAA